VVLGVKEIPVEKILPKRSYVFFSHTIKGQSYNMPLLRRVLDARASLLDYECITDEQGQRLVAFGRQAGQAGMIDTLWALGCRLAAEGYAIPLDELRPAWRYASLAEALAAVEDAGRRMRAEGLPAACTPLVVGITGHGRVASGAWEVMQRLEPLSVPPEELPRVHLDPLAKERVVECRLLPEHYVAREDGAAFDFEHFLAHPELYRATIEHHLPHLSALVNGIYWDERYPKLVTRRYLEETWNAGESPRLRVIGDVTCDIRGAVESTVAATTPESPTYLYRPDTDEAHAGVLAGPGPLVLAVDNLPCELPREASQSFGDALAPLIEALVAAHDSGTLAPDALPDELGRALIAHEGRLRERFAYLEKHLP
jgi:alpha-aminoadipic semialdehyde synthase